MDASALTLLASHVPRAPCLGPSFSCFLPLRTRLLLLRFPCVSLHLTPTESYVHRRTNAHSRTVTSYLLSMHQRKHAQVAGVQAYVTRPAFDNPAHPTPDCLSVCSPDLGSLHLHPWSRHKSLGGLESEHTFLRTERQRLLIVSSYLFP